jgi:membrane-bound serine protease (ClpP class)
MSADVAAMSPGTETGAASPLLEFGGSPVKVDDTLSRKITNDATAYLRSYTSQRGRNVDLAATAVTDAKAFSADEALKGNLIDAIAASKEDLFAKLEGRTITRFDGAKVQLHFEHPTVVAVEMTGRQKFLMRIVQPDVFFILLILGVLGLYTEFTHPGVFAPGVIGGIALVLALFAMHLLPVSLAGLLLIAVSFALFILEAKFPTHGVLGVGGVVAMVLGAVFLVKSPLTGMGVSLFTAICVAIPFAVIVIFLMRLVLKSRSWKPATGKEELIGEVGEVREEVREKVRQHGDVPESFGSVFVHGELWRAAARAGEAIPVGARVRVKKVNGLTLEVEPVEQHS